MGSKAKDRSDAFLNFLASTIFVMVAISIQLIVVQPYALVLLFLLPLALILHRRSQRKVPEWEAATEAGSLLPWINPVDFIMFVIYTVMLFMVGILVLARMATDYPSKASVIVIAFFGCLSIALQITHVILLLRQKKGDAEAIELESKGKNDGL